MNVAKIHINYLMKKINSIIHTNILDLFISLIAEIDAGYNCVSTTISMSINNEISWMYNSGNNHYISLEIFNLENFSYIPIIYDDRMLNIDEFLTHNREIINKMIKMKAFL